MNDNTPLSDELLQHAAFVRGLARRLTSHRHEADDVEQDLWLAAIRKPPAVHHTSLRAWFSIVAKNLVARNRRRSQSAFVTNSAGQETTIPSASSADIVAQQELIQGVVESVFGLPEPYKTTIIQRYYEGLSLRQIGEREGSSIAVVRHRLDRAIEMLRAELDHFQDPKIGDWRRGLTAFCLADAHLGSTSSVTQFLSLGALVMKLKTAALALLVLVIGVLAFLTWNFSRDLEQRDLEIGEAGTGSAAARIARRDSQGNPTKLAVEDSQLSNASSRENMPVDSEVLDQAVVLQVVWQSDGQPAIDVPLWVMTPSWGTNRSEVRTDAAGRMTIDKLEEGGARIHCPLAPHVVLRRIEKEEKTRVVRVEIPRGIDVRGKVVDENGKPVSGADVVLASSYTNVGSAAMVTQTKANGEFSLRQVAPTVWVAARKDRCAPSNFASLREVTSDNPTLTLVMNKSGARIRGKILDDRGAPVAGALVKAGRRDGIVVTEQNIAHYQGPAVLTFSQDDGSFDTGITQAGDLRLIVKSQDLGLARHVRQLHVARGETAHVQVRLAPPARVFGFVRDQDGLALKGIHFRSGHNDDDIPGPLSSSDKNGYFEINCPAGQQIEVSSRRVKKSFALRSGEQREWNPVLDVGTRTSGKLHGPAGVSLGGWSVTASTDTFGGKISPVWSQYTQSSTDGEFSFIGCPKGEKVELTFSRDDFSLGMPVLAMTATAGDRGIVAELTRSNLPSARIKGQVLDGEGQRPTHVEVILRSNQGGLGRSMAVSSADGIFELGPLAPGIYRLHFKATGLGAVTKSNIELATNQVLELGVVQFDNPAELIVDLIYPHGEIAGLVSLNLANDRSNNAQTVLKGQSMATFRVAAGKYTLSIQGDPKLVDASAKTMTLKSGSKDRVEFAIKKPKP